MGFLVYNLRANYRANSPKNSLDPLRFGILFCAPDPIINPIFKPVCYQVSFKVINTTLVSYHLPPGGQDMFKETYAKSEKIFPMG